ncbi:MAG: UvrB/UvrC motif-containing protein [Phycisphaerae bacterium]|jgi:protein arginine kinase activator
MSTKCDRCDNEATVHEVSVRNGMKVERHLCESCAAQHGIDASITGNAVVTNLVKSLMTQQGGTPQGRLPACRTCRMTFADFKQQGMLGCPECYRSFEAFLGPLIERAQEGGVSHAGKTPVRLLSGLPMGSKPASRPAEPAPAKPAGPTREEQIRELRRQLSKAVAAEQYEAAARLRDAIQSLSQGSGEDAA